MELKNYTEIIVKQVYDELIKERKDVCNCERCQLDIVAKALNNLPAQYYVTPEGEVFSKVAASYLDFRTKILTEVIKAILQISKNPHHPGEEHTAG